MYCSICGQQLQANQQVCPKCGRAVAGAIPPVAAQARVSPSMAASLLPSRLQRHVHTLAILWLVYAGWLMVSWAFAATFLAGMFGMRHQWGPFGPMGPFDSTFSHLSWLLPFVTLIVVARSILAVLTGVALLRRQRWGRTLALVASFFALLKPLTGTLLGIYTLWVLLPSDSAQEYDGLAV